MLLSSMQVRITLNHEPLRCQHVEIRSKAQTFYIFATVDDQVHLTRSLTRHTIDLVGLDKAQAVSFYMRDVFFESEGVKLKGVTSFRILIDSELPEIHCELIFGQDHRHFLLKDIEITDQDRTRISLSREVAFAFLAPAVVQVDDEDTEEGN